MLKPSVASCFNPSCSSRFRRMGEGRLFVEPERGNDHPLRVVWLCNTCSHQYTLDYDFEEKEFVLKAREQKIA